MIDTTQEDLLTLAKPTKRRLPPVTQNVCESLAFLPHFAIRCSAADGLRSQHDQCQ